MKKKSILNLSLAIMFSLFSIVSFAPMLIPNVAQAMLADDEKNTVEECPVNPQLTRTICTAGTTDCTPKNC